jgi:hypothetical protein
MYLDTEFIRIEVELELGECSLQSQEDEQIIEYENICSGSGREDAQKQR